MVQDSGDLANPVAQWPQFNPPGSDGGMAMIFRARFSSMLVPYNVEKGSHVQIFNHALSNLTLVIPFNGKLYSIFSHSFIDLGYGPVVLHCR
jgi:hypothetical protein